MTSIYPQRVKFGPFEADLETHELWKNGVKLKLGGQPFEILAVLLNRPGQMVSREELQKEIWAADTFVDFNHGLNAAVNKLRETLSDSAEEPKYIETLPRRGYRFIGKIENAVSELAVAKPKQVEPPPHIAPPPIQIVAKPAADWDSEARRAGKRRRLVAAILATAAVVGGAVIVYRWWTTQGLEVREQFAKLAEERALSNMLTLVPDPASDPAISPDGKMVAFRRNSYASGAAGIFVTGSNGQALTQLTQHPGDCCPAWSPDGKMLAFTRIAADEYGIYVVNAAGGQPRKISHEDPRKKRGELAWTADGKFIAFSGDSPQGGSQIFLLSVKDSSVQALTEPQGQDRDWGPSFSPDGTQMAFVRANGAGFPEEVYVMAMSGGVPQKVAYSSGDGKGPLQKILVTPQVPGPPRQLTYQRAAIMGPPVWSSDGESIIFASTKAGEPALCKIPAAGGEVTQIPQAGDSCWHPTISRVGNKLVVQKILRASGIYRVDLSKENGQHSKTVVTSTNGRNEGPSLSPDGKRMLFMSDRSGSMEIWVSNRDGLSPLQLTNLHGSGTPRWSPDGASVAFDSTGNGAPGIFVVSAFGSTPRAVVQDDFENSVPSWSRDGKWIYFGSHRTKNEDQVWKVPAQGGKPIQVTQNGGFAAWESPDGKTLYYAKTRYENPEIWKMPVDGGPETIVSTAVRPKSWAAWSVTDRGIFFCPHEGSEARPVLEYFDFASQLTQQLSLLERSPFWVSATPDGKEVFYDQAGQDESSILLVESYK